jgi:hypothetical protein
MTGDVLDELRASVQHLADAATADNARAASDAARAAWADIYSALLLDGSYPSQRLDLFGRLLDECAGALGRVKDDPYAPHHRERIAFYRELLRVLNSGGVAAVESTLEGALSSLQRRGGGAAAGWAG